MVVNTECIDISHMVNKTTKSVVLFCITENSIWTLVLYDHAHMINNMNLPGYC